MKRNLKLVLTFTGFGAVLLVFAFAVSGAHSPQFNPTDSVHHDTVLAPAHDAAHHDARGTALADMQAYAHRKLGHVEPRLDTFRSNGDWSSEWDLHWIDVEHDGRVARIYHVTEKVNPQRRFAWMWDSGSPQPTAWEEVR